MVVTEWNMMHLLPINTKNLLCDYQSRMFHASFGRQIVICS